MIKGAACVLMFLLVACEQAFGIQTGDTTIAAGPGGIPMKAEWAVAIQGSFDYRCDFNGSLKKAIVIYQLVGKEWKPIISCHNGGGTAFGRMPGSTPPARLAVTGWYGEGNTWKQCDLNGWKKNVDGSYLSYQAPDGGTLLFTCAKSQCRKP